MQQARAAREPLARKLLEAQGPAQHSPVAYVLEAEAGFLTDGTARARWNPKEHEEHLHLYRCRLFDFDCWKELRLELSMTECNARSEQ